MSADREHEITRAFSSVAGSLIEGMDVIDLLAGLTADCAQLLDVASAGLLLADSAGVLHLLAASSEATRGLEMFQLQRDQGPCLDCFSKGEPVHVPDIGKETERWPQFVPAAITAGFASVHALPMRLRGEALGTLGLFGIRTGALGEDDLALAQGLAHVASLALVYGNDTPDPMAVARQLQGALTSRVVLEQAKGMLASQGEVDMDQALAALRDYARSHRRRLSEVAGVIVDRELPAQAVLDHCAALTTPQG